MSWRESPADLDRIAQWTAASGWPKLPLSTSREDEMVAVTAELAKRATALAWRDFPDDLLERTKQCLLDWFAVTVAGAQEELTDILVREAIEDGAKGTASLVGRSEMTLPSTAALINGASSHALDYDDVNFA